MSHAFPREHFIFLYQTVHPTLDLYPHSTGTLRHGTCAWWKWHLSRQVKLRNNTFTNMMQIRHAHGLVPRWREPAHFKYQYVSYLPLKLKFVLLNNVCLKTLGWITTCSQTTFFYFHDFQCGSAEVKKPSENINIDLKWNTILTQK